MKERAMPVDRGLEALIAYLERFCTIDGCAELTDRKGQPCDLCELELGAGG